MNAMRQRLLDHINALLALETLESYRPSGRYPGAVELSGGKSLFRLATLEEVRHIVERFALDDGECPESVLEETAVAVGSPPYREEST